MNITKDIDSLTSFKRNTAVFLKRIKKSGDPLILTVNGKAEVVIQSASAYQQMLDILDRAEAIVGIGRGLEGVERGESQDVDQAFGDLRKKHGIASQR